MNGINIKTNLTGPVILFAIIFLLFFLSHKDADEYNKYEKTFKGETIGLATRIEHKGKRDYLRYYFYVNKKILSEIYSKDDNHVNKFFKVKYDLNNPEKGNYIILEEELKPDSLALVRAGFTKTKYYTYDDVKAEYLGEWKWK